MDWDRIRYYLRPPSGAGPLALPLIIAGVCIVVVGIVMFMADLVRQRDDALEFSRKNLELEVKLRNREAKIRILEQIRDTLKKRIDIDDQVIRDYQEIIDHLPRYEDERRVIPSASNERLKEIVLWRNRH
jgi:RNase adaptor protein for sRNA GlmZ degradation